MLENKPQSTYLYLLLILSGVISAIATFVSNLQAIYSALGLAVSLILMGVGVLGWFVSQKKISFVDGVQYSVIWTLLILLAGTGYYLIISRPVTVSGSLFDNNLLRNPISGYEIVLYNHKTGITSRVRTDTQGNFVFSDVTSGEYDIIINNVIVRSEEASSGLQKLIVGDIRAGHFYLDSLNILQPQTPIPVSVTPTPPATTDLLASALQLARNFDGNNDSWKPFVWEFDNIQMVLVPVGCFMMGSFNGEEDEKPPHEICFDEPFWIDQFEVTNEQFALFGGISAQQSRITKGNHPIDTVNWVEASDFCELRGGRLPTEAEWEYAARGPDNLVYPWGDEFDPLNVNFCDTNCSMTWKVTDFNDGYAFSAPIGTYPLGVSWVGAYDMSGNVWEWVSTIYNGYPYNPTDGRESLNNTTGRRVFRGGSWASIGVGRSDFVWDVRTAFRDKDTLQFANDQMGLRCARNYE